MRTCKGFVTVVYIVVAVALSAISVTIQWVEHEQKTSQDGAAAKPPVVHKQGSEGASEEHGR